MKRKKTYKEDDRYIYEQIQFGSFEYLENIC